MYGLLHNSSPLLCPMGFYGLFSPGAHQPMSPCPVDLPAQRGMSTASITCFDQYESPIAS